MTISWRSWRWWFEDRSTGDITIAQPPNWPIWAIVACWLLRLVLADGSTPDDLAGWAIHGLWLVWGTDELTRGVNPWRRLLGAAVIAWQIVSIVTTIG